jgi:hypothetical protein
MSTSLLYHGFGVRGYDYVKSKYESGEVTFTLGPKAFELQCSRARSSNVLMLKRFANNLAAHKNGLLAYYDYPISTGPLGGYQQQNQNYAKASLRLQGYVIF